MWVIGECTIIDEKGKEIRKWVTRYKNYRLRHFSSKALLSENFVSQMGVFFRRQALEKIGGLDSSLHYSMDYDLWLRFAQQFQPGLLNARIGKFRMYATSKSVAFLEKQLRENLRIIKKNAPGKRWPVFLQRVHSLKILWSYRVMTTFKNVERLLNG
jgi:GT2 family glycosyltransferase